MWTPSSRQSRTPGPPGPLGITDLGKSTYVAWLIAALTTGRPLPGDTEHYAPIRCAVLSLEESKKRVVARLTAAGANLELVTILSDVEDMDDDGRAYRRAWRLPADTAVLEDAIAVHGLDMVCVDGLGYAVTGDGGYASVGSAMTGLASVAERTGCAIVGCTHPPKGGADPVTAAIGSTAWTAVARLTWLLGATPDDEGRRVLRVGKSNYRLPEAGYSFAISDDGTYECGYVTGLATSTVDPGDLVAAPESKYERTDREEARDLVRDALLAGDTTTAELLRQTRAAGYSDTTVKRARRDLGVISEPVTDPATGRRTGHLLRLPDHRANPQGQTLPGPVDPVDSTRGNVGPGVQWVKAPEPGPVDAVTGDADAPYDEPRGLPCPECGTPCLAVFGPSSVCRRCFAATG